MEVQAPDKTLTVVLGEPRVLMSRLTIPATMLTGLGALLGAAERNREEKCALLTGKVDETGVIVCEVVPVRNRARSNAAFSIAAEDFRRVNSGAYPVVAVFHTHRRTTQLSREDVRMMTGSSLVHLVGSPCYSGSEFAEGLKQTFNLRGYANFEDNDICSITIEVKS